MSVWVLDQDSAREFYTGKLGFELTNDVRLDSGMRWMTARPQGNASQEFLLMDPSHSMLDSRSRLDPSRSVSITGVPHTLHGYVRGKRS